MKLHYDTDGEIATFTIENGNVNPFTPELHKEFYRTLKVGILTGAGTRAFSAGDDLKTKRPKEREKFPVFFPVSRESGPENSSYKTAASAIA